MVRTFRVALLAAAFVAPLAVLGCGPATNSTTAPKSSTSGDKMGGDKMGGDKMHDDKMGGDKMGGDKMSGDKMGGDKMAPATTK